MAIRHVALGLLAALALAAHAGAARADDEPPYTLSVDSDAASLSFDALAAQLAGDLRSPIVKPAERAKVAIIVHYRTSRHELTVRAEHPDGHVLERTVVVIGDDAAVLREATLLAGNLARDESRELLDELATKAPPPPVAQATPAAAATPPPPEDDFGATVALAYPLATNGGRPNVTSHFDLSLLFGRVGHVDGAQIGGLAAYASRGVEGAQVTTAVNAIHGDLVGVQASGLINVTRGKVDGVQATTVLNYANDDTTGVQAAAGPNIARRKLVGVQATSTVNVARSIDGVQGGIVNVAEDVHGLQLGIVNIGRHVKGTQIGVVNIADDVDQAVGLVSISRDNVHPIAWASNLAYSNAGVKFTGKYVFTSLAINYGSLETAWRRPGINFAVGTTIPVTPISRKLDAEVELDRLSIPLDDHNDRENFWLSPRLNVGYSVAKHLRFFVGVSSRFAIDVAEGDKAVRPEVLGGVQL